MVLDKFLMNRSFMVCSWNVRGLGDPVKCGDVLVELLASNPNLVMLQETKLSIIPDRKLYSFLPRRLNSFVFSAASGSSGGMLIAWSDSLFTCLGSSTTPNTLSVHLTSTLTGSSFYITNVYAPASPEVRYAFLDEFKSIVPPHHTPWMISGDFNMIRFSHEKNNANFRFAEAEAFNDCINDMSLIELPLTDRSFTWSNKRSRPTLERLDRVFINLTWDEMLPSTVLSSLTRTTSDHVPLRIDISTIIPKSSLFRFENYWVTATGFRDIVAAAWNCRTGNSDPSAVLNAKLKETRHCLREWRKQIPRITQQETDCKIVINLLDCVEETRPLSPPELALRTLIVTILSRVSHSKLLLWKQRSKVRAALEGDENARYFHACANQRHRRNRIQVLEHDGCEIHNHDQKAAVLHAFYHELLGCDRATTWGFQLEDLYPEGPLPLGHLDAAFERAEIHQAFRRMHPTASPGPDGFGPLFFKASWNTISPDIYALFYSFHSHTTELERLNRSYLVLLPKKDVARRPQDFRPIALQNSTVKGISKVLTTRLQPSIPSLICND